MNSNREEHNGGDQYSAFLSKFDKKNSVDINVLHQQLGHPNELIVKKTSKEMGIVLTGKFKICESCELAKSRRSNMNKINYNHSSIPGERLYTDISYLKSPSYGGSNNWILIVDECTRMKWSIFCNKRSNMGEIISKFVRDLQLVYNKEVKYIRCDNAGENALIEANLREIGIGSKIEKTAPYTPEQNGMVERPFQTLFNSVREMLNHTNLEGFQKINYGKKHLKLTLIWRFLK